MRYDSADRILSLSFTRDPAEHADVMIEAGRRMMTSTDPISAWTGFGVAIGFGAVVGIVMEVHRRFLLPLMLGPSDIAPFGTVFLQLLPLILLVIVLYVAILFRSARSRRKALVSRLQPNLFIDVDIFTKGLTSSSGASSVDIDWSAVRSIFVQGNRIELECEGFYLYIPERAFANRAAFNEGAKEIRDIWREALKRERDSKLVAAGLD